MRPHVQERTYDVCKRSAISKLNVKFSLHVSSLFYEELDRFKIIETFLRKALPYGNLFLCSVACFARTLARNLYAVVKRQSSKWELLSTTIFCFPKIQSAERKQLNLN